MVRIVYRTRIFNRTRCELDPDRRARPPEWDSAVSPGRHDSPGSNGPGPSDSDRTTCRTRARMGGVGPDGRGWIQSVGWLGPLARLGVRHRVR